MKYTWEPDDIKPGRYYGRASKHEDLGYLATVIHKIGFDPRCDLPVSISIADGMVIGYAGKSAMAKALNDGGYIPIRTEQLIRVIEHLRKQNEGDE